MSTGFSSDIAKAKLMEIDTQISISPTEFIQSLSSTSSYTEKTLLVLAFLSTVDGKPVLKKYLQKIKQCFITQNFTEINRLIKEIITKPGNFIEKSSLSNWSEALENLKNSYSIDIVYSSNNDTSSRRMFESILGQRYLASDNTLKDFQRHYASIQDTEELSVFISKTLMDEKGSDADDAWEFWEIEWFRINTTNDRGRGTPKLYDSQPQVRTPGILTYTTPRPMYMYDREIPFKKLTSQSDKNRSTVNPLKPNWVQQNPENPYVASFSGHALFFISLLIIKCKKKPENVRQDFFNTMLKAYITVYLSQGFHSLKEICDIISDSEILASLKIAGIEVNLEQLFDGPDGILDKTFADSIEYNKNYLLKKSTLENLKETQGNITSSDFVDPRENYLAKKARQRNTEHNEEIRKEGVTLEEIQLREKLFSGDISPIQALKEMPESKLIVNIALSVDPDLLDSLDMKQVASIYEKGFLKDEILMNRLQYNKIDIKTSNDGFWKSDSALSHEEKNSNIMHILYKLQMACLKKDESQINSIAKALFKTAGSVRNAFTYQDFSSTTTSAKSLLKILQQPDNAYILKALKINPGIKSNDIHEALVYRMEKAFNDKNVIPMDKPELPARRKKP